MIANIELWSFVIGVFVLWMKALDRGENFVCVQFYAVRALLNVLECWKYRSWRYVLPTV